MANFKTFTITLLATGAGPPAIVRLRRALKFLWRSCGFRVVRISEGERISEGDEKIK
jgi:hypothetical protein